MAGAPVFWIATVRPDGRPHITPLLAVTLDGALHFCTGPDERKAKNLERNPSCILLKGSNALDHGLDVVVEGDARRVLDHGRLERLAAAYLEKYGDEWRFEVRDGGFAHAGGSVREEDVSLAHVYEVAPARALGFARGATYSQTRWTFPR
jgi:nitroimidazol reductase NimA-like FMN-containing flavoprotein (pyridoxamine 5'-phosphate oxidase superfamily)